MPLIITLFGFFIIKALVQLPFYFKRIKPMLLVALCTTFMIAPFITILYHETSIDFWYVYFAMIMLDAVILYLLVQRNWWKAIPAAFLVSTITIVFFYLGNG